MTAKSPSSSRNPLTGLGGLQLVEGGKVLATLKVCRNPLTGLGGLQPDPAEASAG